MFTIVRVRKTGEVNYLNLVNKQEAMNAYIFTTFYAEEDRDSFVGLFHQANMLMNNKQRNEKAKRADEREEAR